MVFSWFRARAPDAAAPSTDETASLPLLHDRVRAALGDPGGHLCRPLPGGELLSALCASTPVVAFLSAGAPTRTALVLRARSPEAEHFLVLERARSAATDAQVCGLLPPPVVRDPWRLASVLERLFDANLQLDPPLLGAPPEAIEVGALLPTRHLRGLLWLALRQLPVADPNVLAPGRGPARTRPTPAAFESWWQQTLARCVAAPEVHAAHT
jgi:hypothetical protein